MIKLHNLVRKTDSCIDQNGFVLVVIGRGGGGTSSFGLNGFEPLNRVWFFKVAGLKKGIQFHFSESWTWCKLWRCLWYQQFVYKNLIGWYQFYKTNETNHGHWKRSLVFSETGGFFRKQDQDKISFVLELQIKSFVTSNVNRTRSVNVLVIVGNSFRWTETVVTVVTPLTNNLIFFQRCFYYIPEQEDREFKETRDSWFCR